MSKKTNPEVDDELDLDADEDPADDLADLDDPVDDADDEPAAAPAKRPAKKSGSKKSASRRGKSGSTQSAFVTGGKRPAGKSGGRSVGKGGRGHIAPVKVAGDRPWGTIALFAVVGLLFVGIVGYTGWQAYVNDLTPQERARLISGVKDYTDDVKKEMGNVQHKDGNLEYPLKPPVGGTHNGSWQNCQGNVYDAPIADEHAVHSLEHGAIWITYQPDLPKAEVETLAKKVRNKDYMMLSPYKGQSSKISVQAWGFQLQVDSADDSRIDDFTKALRNEGPEKGATCSSGITVTGDEPREVAPPQQPGAPGGPGDPQAPPGGAPQAPPGG